MKTYFFSWEQKNLPRQEGFPLLHMGITFHSQLKHLDPEWSEA